MPPEEALARAADRIDHILQEHASEQHAPAAPEETATPGSPSRVTFWYCAHPLVSPALADSSPALAAFTRDHPDVTLDAQFIGEWPYAIQKLTVALAVGDTPDVALVKRPWAGRLIEAGRVTPLDGLLPADLVNDLKPEVVHDHTINGKLYALPADGFCSVLFYDSERVTNPPQTWETLIARAKSLASPAAGSQGAFYPIGDVPFLESLWSAGGSVYAQGKSGLSQPPAAEALRFVLGLRDAGLADPSVLGQPEACVAALARGDVTMTVASSFEVTTLKRAGKSIGVAPVPGKSGPLSLRSGDVLVVFPKYAAAKRAAIAALLDFLTGPEVQGQRAAALGSVPVRRSVSEKTLINPGLEMAFAASRSTPLDGIWGEAEYELNRYLALAYLWRPQPL